MGKRKRSRSKDGEDYYHRMRKKVKKLERKLQRYRRSSASSSERSYFESLSGYEDANIDVECPNEQGMYLQVVNH